MDSPNQAKKTVPDWIKFNFHQVMVLLCDTFAMSHPEMMALRQKIEAVYGDQQEVSIKALAILAYRQFEKQPDKTKALDWVLKAGKGKLIKTARKIDRELYGSAT